MGHRGRVLFRPKVTDTTSRALTAGTPSFTQPLDVSAPMRGRAAAVRSTASLAVTCWSRRFHCRRENAGAKGQCRFAPARFVIAAGFCSSTLADFPPLSPNAGAEITTTRLAVQGRKSLSQ